MGNNAGKKEIDPFQKNLDELFFTISNKKKYIARNDLMNAWKNQVDENFYEYVEMYLFRNNQNELNHQTFKNFYFDTCKGATEQKLDVLCQLIFENEKISRAKLQEFIKSILKSILIISKIKSAKKYNSWSTRLGRKPIIESIDKYSDYFISKINKNEEDEFAREDLKNLLPEWKCSPLDFGKTLEQISELNLLEIIFLNSELPFDCQIKWKPLFSTKINGESFAILSGQIINQGPTIILIKDKENYVFGAFSSQNWTLGPTFFGDSSSFLFTLHPKMNLYKATNFNNNYQYMNTNQKTMPNGLGMGGRIEYFGLWISAEFGKGYCSESCTSFRDYKMLSKYKNFEISHLEVWGVDVPEPISTELEEKSVLDTNVEAKAILELCGKTTYSQAFREE